MIHFRFVIGIGFFLIFSFSSMAQKTSAKDTTLAGQYLLKATQLKKKGNHNSAVVYLKKAGTLYRKAKAWEPYIACLNRLNAYLIERKLYRQAKRHIHRAFIFGPQKLGENHPQIAASYSHMGRLLLHESAYEKAFPILQKSLKIRLDSLGAHHIDVSDSYFNLGMLYQARTNYEQALQSYLKTLDILQKNPSEASDFQPQEALVYEHIGTAYSANGNNAPALKFHRKSLESYLKNPGRNSIQAAASYHNIAMAYANQKNYRKGLASLQQSLSILKTILGENHWKVTNCHHQIGLMYFQQNNYEQALFFLNKALQQRIIRRRKTYSDLAHSYYAIGDVHHDRGNRKQALLFHQKALKVRLATLVKHHPLTIDSYNRIAMLYTEDRASIDKALSYYQTALQLNVPGFTSNLYQKNPPSDKSLSAQALLKTFSNKAYTLMQRYLYHKKLADLKLAFATYQQAAKLIDQMRSAYQAKRFRLFLAAYAPQFYEQAIECALHLYKLNYSKPYLKYAFQFTEKHKSITLREAISQINAQHFYGLPDSLLDKERQISSDMHFYARKINTEKLKRGYQNRTKLKNFTTRLSALKKAHHDLLVTFETTYPEYFDLKQKTTTISIVELQSRLNKQTVLVEYFLGEKHIYIFTITSNDYNLHTVPRDTHFTTLVTEMRNACKRPPSESAYQTYTTNAFRLYKLLIQPLETEIGYFPYWIIVPDGILSYLPFEALLSESPSEDNKRYAALSYLLKKHRISYACSAKFFCQPNGLLQTVAPSPPFDYLAFAPVFPNGLPPKSKGLKWLEENGWGAFDRSTLGALTGSEKEVLNIQQLFLQKYSFLKRFQNWISPEATMVFLLKEASEAKLKSCNPANYRFLHIATHGILNEINPGLSGFLLRSDTLSIEDGILHIGEIYNLHLNAKLAILSNCETGVGKLSRGEGIMGLSRGFLYAGVQQITLSLWRVSNLSTRQIMEHLYKGILADKPTSTALHEAKLAMLENELTASPNIWASFVLIAQQELNPGDQKD